MMRSWVLAFVLCASCALGCAARIATIEAPRDDPAVDAEALHRAGLELAGRGDLTRAEQYLGAALRAGYDERASTRALVSVCVRASRLRSALSYATTYLGPHPGDVPLRRLVATLHLALGQPDEARRELTRVLVAAPDDADTHYLLALVLGAEDQARAREHFARYLELTPSGRHAEEARAALAGSG